MQRTERITFEFECGTMVIEASVDATVTRSGSYFDPGHYYDVDFGTPQADRVWLDEQTEVTRDGSEDFAKFDLMAAVEFERQALHLRDYAQEKVLCSL